MQKSGTSVAGKEKPKSGKTSPGGTSITINTSAANPSGDGRHDKAEAEQPIPAATPDTTDEPEVIRPPIYEHAQRLRGIGSDYQRTFATPLASTLFGRFDPQHTGVQPAEHYNYIDKQYIKYGRL